MASLCGIRVSVHPTCPCPREQLLQKYKAQRHDFLKKILYLSKMKKCSRDTDLFVCSPEPLQMGCPPTQSMKISTLYHDLLIDYCRDSLLSCIYVLGYKQIPLCEYQVWIFLNYFFSQSLQNSLLSKSVVNGKTNAFGEFCLNM